MDVMGIFKQTRGFTIVELLIVIVVIAILAAITIVAYNGITERANNAQVEANMSNTVKAIELFSADHGVYPSVTADFDEVRDGGLRVKRHAISVNTMLYCVDTANPTSWVLLGYGYPAVNNSNYHWRSDGSRTRGVSINSGTPSCQAQMGGTSTVIGVWITNMATLY